MMNALDLSPLFRSSIGFDQMAKLLDTTWRTDAAAGSYPPYNIEVVEDNKYEISLAVAGFSEEDLEIQVKDKVLTVRGKKQDEAQEKTYVHHAIAARSFERNFYLADYVEVVGADLDNGLLSISLVKEMPEKMKPKTVAIGRQDSKSKSGSKLKAA